MGDMGGVRQCETALSYCWLTGRRVSLHPFVADWKSTYIDKRVNDSFGVLSGGNKVVCVQLHWQVNLLYYLIIFLLAVALGRNAATRLERKAVGVFLNKANHYGRI